MPRVKDLIHNRELYSVEPGQSVAEVAEKMATLNVGAILVLRDGEVTGIFSERDLLKRVVIQGLDAARTRVEEVMSTELTTVQESASVDEAMELMRRCGCRHLPVMRGTKVAGFLSMRDLMGFELERRTEELHEMKRYIQSA